MLLVALLAMGVAVRAQNAPDFSKVEIKTTKLANNFYTLEGQGGTIGTGPFWADNCHVLQVAGVEFLT